MDRLAWPLRLASVPTGPPPSTGFPPQVGRN